MAVRRMLRIDHARIALRDLILVGLVQLAIVVGRDIDAVLLRIAVALLVRRARRTLLLVPIVRHTTSPRMVARQRGATVMPRHHACVVEGSDAESCATDHSARSRTGRGWRNVGSLTRSRGRQHN